VRGRSTTVVCLRLADEKIEVIKAIKASDETVGVWVKQAVLDLLEQLATPEGVCSG